MNRIDDKRCWYTPNDIAVGCDCHRVYFQVYMNFEPTVISFCKDWWNGRYSELWTEYMLKLDESPYFSKAEIIRGDHKRYRHQEILYRIIDEFVESHGGYFSNAPTLNGHIYDYGQRWFPCRRHRRNVFLDCYQSVRIMERPCRLAYIPNKIILEAMSNGESVRLLGNQVLDEMWAVLRDDPYFKGRLKEGAFTIYRKIKDLMTPPDERAVLINELLLRYFKINIVKKSK